MLATTQYNKPYYYYHHHHHHHHHQYLNMYLLERRYYENAAGALYNHGEYVTDVERECTDSIIAKAQAIQECLQLLNLNMTTSLSDAVMVSSIQEQSSIQRAASHLMKSEIH